jgi:uncharacterized protein YcaQ
VTTLTLGEARRLSVAGCLLDRPRPSSILEVARRLGGLQTDPVAAVARAEHMVLFSRLGLYDTTDLERLIEDDSLFEYWAFIVPTSDFAVHRETMRRYPRGDAARAKYIREWLGLNAAFRRYILRELRRRGPLRSRDLEDRCVVQWRTGGWNDGKGLTRMLDILWRRGEITVAARAGGERLWDLASRHLPFGEPRRRTGEVARRSRELQLRRRGVARRDEFGRAFDGPPPGADAAFRTLARQGVAVPVQVQGLAGEWWAHRELLERGPGEPRTTLLSPFDRLTKDRERTEELFGFRYRLEMYVPQAKREYGYYVLPILHGERLIGRVDPLLDRKTGVLHVNGVWAEPSAPASAGADVAAALRELAEWLGAGEIRLAKRPPRMWSTAMRAL